MTVDVAELRLAVAAVSHVPLATFDLIDEQGSRRRVSARPRGDELPVEGFRRLLGRAADDASLVGAIRELVRMPGMPDTASLVLGDDPPVTRSVTPRHWRHACVCRVVDYFFSGGARPDAVATAEVALTSAVSAVERRIWGRWDPELAMSVVAFEWPGTEEHDVHLRLEEALEATDSALSRLVAHVDERSGT